MTARGLYTLLFGAAMTLTALSVGSAGALMLGAGALAAWLLSLITAALAALTCRFEERLEEKNAVRGGSCRLRLRLKMRLPLPIAPVQIVFSHPGARQAQFHLHARLMGTTVCDPDFLCPHVGLYPVGVQEAAFGDCFGLFLFTRRMKRTLPVVTVLPNPAKIAPLRFSPGEGESSAAQRAQADRTVPEDTRAWQEGDEMKRVHWKLSMRRQELMVHTYETPQRPDALILLNCAPPPEQGARRAQMIDALTEVCAGAAKNLLEENRIVRIPLAGDTPREISGQEPGALGNVLEALAQERFMRRSDFARVLLLSSRRMRRTGSTLVLSGELTPAIADAVIALSRMGPHTRFTLVTCGGMTADQETLLMLLLSSGVETTHVAARA